MNPLVYSNKRMMIPTRAGIQQVKVWECKNCISFRVEDNEQPQHECYEDWD